VTRLQVCKKVAVMKCYVLTNPHLFSSIMLAGVSGRDGDDTTLNSTDPAARVFLGPGLAWRIFPIVGEVTRALDHHSRQP